MEQLEYTKIRQLPEKSMKRIGKGKATREMKRLMGIPENDEYQVGDTIVHMGIDVEVGDVYKTTWRGGDYFYLVTAVPETFGRQNPFCYSFYPV